MEALVWLIVEALAALGLLIVLVWWTWPRRNPKDDTDEGR